jgi:hypothetical protein
MAMTRFKGFVGAIAAGALFASSTNAFASPGANVPEQINPWAALTVLSGGAPAAAVCGAAAVAAVQPAPTGCVLPVVDAPPPPPVASAPPLPPPVPVEAAAGYGFGPILASLAAVAVGVGLFFLVKGHHHNHNQPNSPG